MIHIYGIKNCNTVKKSLDWFAANKIPFTFHDFKKEPAQETQLLQWEEIVSWEQLVNKKGTTWKKLNAQEQEAVIDAPSANKVLLNNNSMIKRPVIVADQDIILGFDEHRYNEVFK